MNAEKPLSSGVGVDEGPVGGCPAGPSAGLARRQIRSGSGRTGWRDAV